MPDLDRCQCRCCRRWFAKEECLRARDGSGWICQGCFMDAEIDAEVSEE